MFDKFCIELQKFSESFVKTKVFEKLKNRMLRGKFDSFGDPRSLNDARRALVDFCV